MPSLELLREADMILNACGRPSPPPGYKFVDLPRAIPWFWFAASGAGTPYQFRISNNSDTVFLLRGVATNNPVSLRVKFPDGRFLSQFPSQQADGDYPTGLGSQMYALNQERAIQAGGRFTVEISGLNAGSVKVTFWGVVRYMMRELEEDAGGAGAPGRSDCIVGYPSAAVPNGGKRNPAAARLLMMPDPVRGYENMPRLKCGPNQNILAPEFLLGDQCCLETPDGYEDESFTFFSQPIVVPVNGQNYGNAVIVPGADDVVIKSITGFTTLSGGLPSTIPTFTLRLPNGYSITGGDMVPLNLFVNNGVTFPTLRVRAGDRLIIDMADAQGVGIVGESTTLIQFDGVKRRRKAA